MNKAVQNHMKRTKLAGIHLFLKANARDLLWRSSDAKATSNGALGSKASGRTVCLRERSRAATEV